MPLFGSQIDRDLDFQDFFFQSRIKLQRALTQLPVLGEKKPQFHPSRSSMALKIKLTKDRLKSKRHPPGSGGMCL